MSRPTGVFKTKNDYARTVGAEFFDSIPKAVWAAIAISALTCGGDRLSEAAELVAKEWEILHANGIVPQPANKEARAAIAAAKGEA